MVRVAAVQFATGQDVTANLATCLRMIDSAAGRGAELIVLPEFCNHLSWYESRDHARRLACRHGDRFLDAVAGRAARHRAYVKLGVTLDRGDGRVTGASLLYGPSGTLLGEADKQVLMGAENDHLDPGTVVGPVVATPVGRLGMYACMEGVISEVTRGLALRGAQVLLNSLNSFAVDEASLHVPVRAAENRVWVIAANKVGPLLPADRAELIGAGLGIAPGWLHGAGESQVVAPDGTVVARAPRTGEAVVVADVDVALADDKVRADGTDVLACRRPALYRPIAAEPRGRRAPAGAHGVAVAVVRPRAGPGSATELLRRAAEDGVRLLVLPELCGVRAEEAARAVRGTGAHVVLSEIRGRAHEGLLVSAEGIVGRQRKLHPSARQAGRVTVFGDRLEVFALPWGRLAVVVGDDTVFPETFRLAALADADVVAAPFTPSEPWELRYGLLERAAENRLNVVAAGHDGPEGLAGAILAAPRDFTLWTAWEGPFTGRISHPVVTPVGNGDRVVRAEVHPAQAVNRHVSRGTDLVDGRPWRLADALVEGEA
ncbi:putative amidohydrolase [Streptosporangium becharense]|uniref:Putative amidohydrolase n=1 Tax=Streptosporangium becharense TaxID=1816182 RepID=A0A7W9IMU4_9ACTN|nr:nitrilase-related carbon-nitrogen hydrolase [Streptosporangium becharense]MBB2914333.1 putative amidohydrolase [Streptosporangium becharense]MBB5823635.1 putative amidohydrolase [Streptosporangium becharense]